MKTTIQVQNLKCNGCATTIKNKLLEIDHISNMSIDVETSQLTFEYKDENDFETVKNSLLKLGYPMEGEENKLQTKAKSFVSCAIGRMNN